MTDSTFDFSDFLNTAADGTALPLAGTDAGNSAPTMSAELTDFPFTWPGMGDEEAPGESANADHNADSLPGDMLPFFALDNTATAQTHAEGSAVRADVTATTTTATADPFSFFDAAQPATESTLSGVFARTHTCQPQTAANARQSVMEATSIAMPPPAPLSPATRQKMKRGGAAPKEAGTTTATLAENPAGPGNGAAAVATLAAQDEETTPQLRENASETQSVDEVRPVSTVQDEEAAAAATAGSGSAASSRAGTASKRPPPSTHHALSMTHTHELIHKSEQRLEHVREREADSRAAMSLVFGAKAQQQQSEAAGVDTSETAFAASCAQLMRQVTQTRETQLRVSEDVHLKATRALALFGPHHGLSSLLGPEYAAVPVAQLLPLLVPLFEELLSNA